MTTTPSSALTRILVVGFGAAAISFGAAALPATASTTPDCPNTSVASPTECCVEFGDAPGPGSDYTSKQSLGWSLLGAAPMVGNLPGLVGLL